MFLYFIPLLASASVASITEDTVVERGAMFTIVCEAAGAPADFTYQWQHGGVIVPGETDAVLVIVSMAAENTGDYTCTPTNSRGNFNSASVHLDMSGRTTVKPPQENILVFIYLQKSHT